MTQIVRDVLSVVGGITLTGLVLLLLVALLRDGLLRQSARAEGRLAAAAPHGVERRALTWGELPGWVNRDHAWVAAIAVLGSDTLAAETSPYVDFPARAVDWDALQEAARHWPTDAQRLVAVAVELAGVTVPDTAVVPR